MWPSRIPAINKITLARFYVYCTRCTAKYSTSRFNSAVMSFASVSHHFAELQTSTSSTLKGKKSISVIPLALTWKSDHTNMGKKPFQSIHFFTGSSFLHKPFKCPAWKWRSRQRKKRNWNEAKKETRVKMEQVVGDTVESVEKTLAPLCFSTCLMDHSQISLLYEPCFVFQWVKRKRIFNPKLAKESQIGHSGRETRVIFNGPSSCSRTP